MKSLVSPRQCAKGKDQRHEFRLHILHPLHSLTQHGFSSSRWRGGIASSKAPALTASNPSHLPVMSLAIKLEDGGQHPAMTGRRWESHQSHLALPHHPSGYAYPRLPPQTTNHKPQPQPQPQHGHCVYTTGEVVQPVTHSPILEGSLHNTSALQRIAISPALLCGFPATPTPVLLSRTNHR